MRLLGKILVRSLHVDDVHAYCAQRLREGAARETIRKELVTLRQSLKLAAERGLMRADPSSLIPRFKAPYKPRERWLRPEEFEKLPRAQKNLGPRPKAAFTVLAAKDPKRPS